MLRAAMAPARARATVLAVGAALAAGVACGPKPAPPAPAASHAVAAPPRDAAVAPVATPLDQDLQQLAARTLQMYQETAKLFASVGEDCAAATARLGQLETTYRAVVAANAKVLHDGRAKELRAALAPHEEPFDFAAKSIAQSATMARCSQDTAFEKAFDALFEVPP